MWTICPQICCNKAICTPKIESLIQHASVIEENWRWLKNPVMFESQTDLCYYLFKIILKSSIHRAIHASGYTHFGDFSIFYPSFPLCTREHMLGTHWSPLSIKKELVNSSFAKSSLIEKDNKSAPSKGINNHLEFNSL